MRSALVGVILTTGLLCSTPVVAAETMSSLHLVKVVMLTRHGIRAPTESTAALAKYGPRHWPQWPVAPGQLTPHGAVTIGLLGRWLRQHYARAGLLSEKGCPPAGAAAVWADNADQRTRVSGQAMIDGLFPGCDLHAYWRPRSYDDPLFHAVETGICPVDPTQAMKSILRHGDPDSPGPGYRQALQRLIRILDGDKACAAGAGICAWAIAPNRLKMKRDGVGLKGPLHVGKTLAGNLLMEYVEGMPVGMVAKGGAASAPDIAAVIPLHTLYYKLMKNTPYLAAHDGTPLAAKILTALQSTSDAQPHKPASAQKMLLFLGHSANLAAVATLLGVDWSLPGQPDPTAPDVTLAFELLQTSGGSRYVRLRVFYQTLDQLRSATPLNATHPAGALTISLPACADDEIDHACALPRFTALLTSELVPQCIPTVPSRQSNGANAS